MSKRSVPFLLILTIVFSVLTPLGSVSAFAAAKDVQVTGNDDLALSGEASPDEAEKYVVNVGDTWNIEVLDTVSSYYRFTPQEDMRIEFYSSSDEDTYGYLYNEFYEILASDDDNGTDRNFKITYDVKAGETYYLYARYYSGDMTGTIEVTLSESEIIDELRMGQNTLNHQNGKSQVKYQYKAEFRGFFTVQVPDMTGIDDVEIHSKNSTDVYSLNEPIPGYTIIIITVTFSNPESQLDYVIDIEEYHFSKLHIGSNNCVHQGGGSSDRYEFTVNKGRYVRISIPDMAGIDDVTILGRSEYLSLDRAFYAHSNFTFYIDVYYTDYADRGYIINVEEYHYPQIKLGRNTVSTDDAVFYQGFILATREFVPKEEGDYFFSVSDDIHARVMYQGPGIGTAMQYYDTDKLIHIAPVDGEFGTFFIESSFYVGNEVDEGEVPENFEIVAAMQSDSELHKGINELSYSGDTGKAVYKYEPQEWGYYCVNIPDLTGIKDVKIIANRSTKENVYGLNEPISQYVSVFISVTFDESVNPLEFNINIDDYHYPELKFGSNTFEHKRGQEEAIYEINVHTKCNLLVDVPDMTGIWRVSLDSVNYGFPIGHPFPNQPTTPIYVYVIFDDYDDDFAYTIDMTEYQTPKVFPGTNTVSTNNYFSYGGSQYIEYEYVPDGDGEFVFTMPDKNNHISGCVYCFENGRQTDVYQLGDRVKVDASKKKYIVHVGLPEDTDFIPYSLTINVEPPIEYQQLHIGGNNVSVDVGARQMTYEFIPDNAGAFTFSVSDMSGIKQAVVIYKGISWGNVFDLDQIIKNEKYGDRVGYFQVVLEFNRENAPENVNIVVEEKDDQIPELYLGRTENIRLDKDNNEVTYKFRSAVPRLLQLRIDPKNSESIRWSVTQNNYAVTANSGEINDGSMITRNILLEPGDICYFGFSADNGSDADIDVLLTDDLECDPIESGYTEFVLNNNPLVYEYVPEKDGAYLMSFICDRYYSSAVLLDASGKELTPESENGLYYLQEGEKYYIYLVSLKADNPVPAGIDL